MANSIRLGTVKIKEVNQQTAQKIKIAAGIILSTTALAAPIMEAAKQIKPGKERWPVKTVTDPNNGMIGKNTILEQDLEDGYVPTTVEELINIPRPADMQPPTQDFAAYQDNRSEPVETTIWQLEADIIALKMETDGDYHLVLQGESGDTMIGEVPNPDPRFVNPNKCPAEYLAGIKQARNKIDTGLKPKLQGIFFVGPVGKNLIPAAALTPSMIAAFPAEAVRISADQMMAGVAFKAKVRKQARVTGIGFFDRIHGQTGVSQTNGIELHPIINIEWINE